MPSGPPLKVLAVGIFVFFAALGFMLGRRTGHPAKAVQVDSKSETSNGTNSVPILAQTTHKDGTSKAQVVSPPKTAEKPSENPAELTKKIDETMEHVTRGVDRMFEAQKEARESLEERLQRQGEIWGMHERDLAEFRAIQEKYALLIGEVEERIASRKKLLGELEVSKGAVFEEGKDIVLQTPSGRYVFVKSGQYQELDELLRQRAILVSQQDEEIRRYLESVKNKK